MSLAVYVPQSSNNWDIYWQKSDYKRELRLCLTDGLLPIFNQYLNKKQRILEAGCGLGKWVIFLSQKGYRIEGVDNNRYAIAALNKNYPKISARLGDVKRLALTDNSLDVYISLGVIEHFQEGPDLALKEAARVLKKGGLALIEVPFDNRLRQLTRAWNQIVLCLKWLPKTFLFALGVKRRESIPKVFYEYHYTREELRGFIKKADLMPIKWYPKDDLDASKSIGLWLDFPKIREQINVPDFRITQAGRLIKRIFEVLGMRFFYSACEVYVARKP